MADLRSDGPLLPLYKLPHPLTVPSSSPPPYSPSPSIDLDLDPSSKTASFTHEERCRNNRRKAIICIILAVMLLVVVPLAVFSVIISRAHPKKGCTTNDGGIMGGDAICE